MTELKVNDYKSCIKVMNVLKAITKNDNLFMDKNLILLMEKIYTHIQEYCNSKIKEARK